MKIDIIHNRNNLFNKNSYTFKEGVTILIGKNGAGKTTLLNRIKEHCELKNIHHFHLDIKKDINQRYGGRSLDNIEQISILANMMESSTGQNNIISFSSNIKGIRKVLQNSNIGDDVVLLFDTIDDGLSINNIIDIKNLFNIIMNDKRYIGRHIYIIATSNSYELCEGYKCINVTTGEKKIFKTYNSYKKYILNTKLGDEDDNGMV